MSPLIILLLVSQTAFAQSGCFSPSDCVAPQYCSTLEDGVTPGNCLDPEPVKAPDPGPIEFEITEGTEGQRQATSSSSADSSSDKEFFIEKLDTYNEIGEELGEYLEDLGEVAEEVAEGVTESTGNTFVNFFTQTVPSFFTSAWCGIFGC